MSPQEYRAVFESVYLDLIQINQIVSLKFA